VTVILDGLSATAPLSRAQTILDGAQVSRRPAVRLQGRRVRHLPRAGPRGRGRHAPQLRAGGAEVDAGFVLTCQSFPVSDSVTVDFDA